MDIDEHRTNPGWTMIRVELESIANAIKFQKWGVVYEHILCLKTAARTYADCNGLDRDEVLGAVGFDTPEFVWLWREARMFTWSGTKVDRYDHLAAPLNTP